MGRLARHAGAVALVAASLLSACTLEAPPGAVDAGARVPAEIASLSKSGAWAAPPDPTNRYADDPRAATLGQKIFFDRSFSGPLLDSDNDGTSGSLGYVGETGKAACASCHAPEAGFTDNRSHRRQISLGAGWGTRHAPSLLNVAHATMLMWDGRHDAHWNQVFGPLEASFELNSSRLFAAQQMQRRYRAEYEAIFGAMPPLLDPAEYPQLDPAHAGCEGLEPTARCHGKPGDGAEYDGLPADKQHAVTRVVVNLGKAVHAYERLLSCGPGRFDAWVAGDETALSEQEKAGAALFTGKGGCSACHSGPLLTDHGFRNVGLKPTRVAYGFVDTGDRGAALGLPLAASDLTSAAGMFSDSLVRRGPNPGDASEGAFRTPSLRCLSVRATFMHTGQFHSLDEVVSFFSRGGDTEGFPGTSVNVPRHLTADEEAALVAFLSTLDGALPPSELLHGL